MSSADAPEEFGPDTWGQTLGMEVMEAGPERVQCRVVIGPQHHQPYGIAHGGVYCSLVEGVASYGAGLAARAAGQRGVVGTSNSTDFLRSTSEGELIAVGEPIHVGRSQQLWSVRIHRSRDDKLVARGQVRFHVLSELPSERDARAVADAS